MSARALTKLRALCDRALKASVDALPDHAALKLGKGPPNLKHQLACRCVLKDASRRKFDVIMAWSIGRGRDAHRGPLFIGQAPQPKRTIERFRPRFRGVFCTRQKLVPLGHGAGPIPTLGELQRATPWVWLWCERCQHHAPAGVRRRRHPLGRRRIERPAAATRPVQRVRQEGCDDPTSRLGRE